MEVPESKHNLRNTKPKDTVEDKCAKITLSSGCKTLSSLQAGPMDEKSKRAARREYQKLNPTVKPKFEPPVKPKCGTLKVIHHGTPVRRKRDHKIKCPVCSEIFKLIKDLNNHVHSKHRRFSCHCGHCTRKFQNYTSCFKHQKTHVRPTCLSNL